MWTLTFSKKADKQLSKMDPDIRRVILAIAAGQRKDIYI